MGFNWAAAAQMVEGIANAGTNIFNAITGRKNYEAQKSATEESNALARDSYNYNKQLNDLQMQREDTAVQRRKADLLAAGFNPVLAAGSSASSSAGTTLTSPTIQAAQNNTKLDKFESVNNMIAALSTMQNIEYVKTLDKKAKLEAEGQATKNMGYELDNNNKIVQNTARILENEFQQIANEEKRFNLNTYERTGVPTNASTVGKLTSEINNLGYNFATTWGNAIKNGISDIGNTFKGMKSSTSSKNPTTPVNEETQQEIAEKILNKFEENNNISGKKKNIGIFENFH